MYIFKGARLITMSALMLLPLVSNAQKATDSQMSEEAAMSLYRTSNRALISQSVRSSKEFIQEQAQLRTQAGNQVSATIVFVEGMPAESVESFIDFYGLELVRAEMKHPIGGEGKVFTMSIGARSLLLKDGPISTKLRQSIGAQQLSLYQSLDPSEIQDSEYLEVVFAPNPKYYKIEVVGRIQNIRDLSEGADISAVQMDNTTDKLNDFIREKNTIEQWKANSPPPITMKLEDGLPPGVSPDQIYRFDRMPDIETLVNSRGHAGGIKQ